MIMFHELQELTKKMDEKHSSSRNNKPVPEKTSVNPNKKKLHEEREHQSGKGKSKSYVLLVLSGIGALILLYLFIRMYIVLGDYIFNSSVFWIIAVIGLIGTALYLFFLFGSTIYASLTNAKESGGKSILVITVFLLVVAMVFTLMNRCT